jgi:hypothetical protein
MKVEFNKEQLQFLKAMSDGIQIKGVSSELLVEIRKVLKDALSTPESTVSKTVEAELIKE